MPFEVIPAIDIRGGKCVRLYRGDFSQETVFSEDPVEVAGRWDACGPPRIHVVDLDGAASGQPVNGASIRRIAGAVRAPVQMGGGLRSLEAVQGALDLGVERVVLGTAAAEDSALVETACRRFGSRMVVGIDAREGLVATRGWKAVQQITAVDLAARMARLGVERIVYTDIARDGALTGPNFAAIQAVASAAPIKVIASGGVASLEHLKRLAALGVEGAIVGRALYTGAVDLAEALAAVR